MAPRSAVSLNTDLVLTVRRVARNPAYKLVKLGDKRYVLWEIRRRGSSGSGEGPELVHVL